VTARGDHGSAGGGPGTDPAGRPAATAPSGTPPSTPPAGEPPGAGPRTTPTPADLPADLAGQERRRRLGALARSRRRRRPTGAAPALPHHLGRAAKASLAALAVLGALLLVVILSPTAARVGGQIDTAVVRALAEVRTPWLTEMARFVDRIATGWTRTVASLALLVALIAFRRWRHLFTFLGSILVLELAAILLYQALARPRPYDVTIIGRWAGYSSPSAPVLVLAAVLVAGVYTMAPVGRPRAWARDAAVAVVAVTALARLYLGVDHPFDVVLALALAVAIPLAAFHWFTPVDAVPVAYGGGKSAHLDVTGARGDAIRRAVADQLGMTLVSARPVGLEGSAGSTPLRLTFLDPATGEEADEHVFAKLFAINHVRADRLYKLGRRVLYGRLEDEVKFENVRRLVAYEDYTLRLLRDAGIPTATPYGIIEITPEREYMLLASFIEGAVEIGEAEVDEAVIDQALGLVRTLWDAGLAHRDIKPANLMVRDGQVFMIDPAFAQVRPSPWRQAVDLGNMMLVLAVRSDAETVYRRAREQFTEDELGEAFAAARGVASPTQLRSMLKKDGRDLLAQFRRMAPARPPVSLQRWSVGRIALAAGLALLVVFAGVQAAGLFTPSHDLGVDGSPRCDAGNLTVLMAQSVPAATMVPCVMSVPVGWETGNADVERGRGRFTLESSTRDSTRTVTVTLRPADACDVGGASPVPSDEVGTERFEQPRALAPGLRSTRYYLFPGGCVTYDFSFGAGDEPDLVFSAETAVAFVDRADLAAHVDEETGLTLCGAGQRCTDGRNQ
jgi:tRNA A-37 threonylcarbamoyl transferase component Bud32